MKNLSITLIQSALHWHDPAKNREMFAEKIASLPNETDLIVLPEMFTTGFTMATTEQSETMRGDTFTWMQDMAKQANAVITGSIIINDNGHYYNRLIWMPPDGAFEYYDKRHLFRMAKEDKHYSAGNRRIAVTLHGWKICPLICYDLRFPVWSRCRNDYDVLLFTANWPSARRIAWQTLLKARAIENLCYVIGLNRTGSDDNDIEYPGGSVVLDYIGKELVNCGETEAIETITLNYEALQQFRQRFPAHYDADAFQLLV